MLKKYRTLIILFAVVALFGILAGIWLHGNYHGKQSKELEYAKDREALTKKLEELKLEARNAERDAAKQVAQQRKEADETIQRLLKENTELRDWWDTSVPADAIDYTYGLRDNGNGL